MARRTAESHRQRIALLCKTLSENHHIKIVFEGTRCETDGNSIYLPAFAEGEVPISLLRDMESHLDHEVAHVLLTDFHQGHDVGEKLNPWYQLFEDMRIEGGNGIRKTWPGCGRGVDAFRGRFYRSKVFPIWDGLPAQSKVWLTANVMGSKDSELEDKMEPKWFSLLEKMQPIPVGFQKRKLSGFLFRRMCPMLLDCRYRMPAHICYLET